MWYSSTDSAVRLPSSGDHARVRTVRHLPLRLIVKTHREGRLQGSNGILLLPRFQNLCSSGTVGPEIQNTGGANWGPLNP